MSQDTRSGDDGRADAERWDERYRDHDGQMWSGEPNGTLVIETTDMAPARVLDLGCGEGADAIWLAQRGWQVTATDISAVAIDRARQEGKRLGVSVDWQCTDVIVDPPPADAFDLIAISYPALKRDRGLSAIGALADAIAPGGELLVIGHADAHHAHESEGGHDPADYVSIDDMISALGDRFTVELDEERDRPNAPEGARHTRDRILRARRTA